MCRLNWDCAQLLNTQIKTIMRKLLQYIHEGGLTAAIAHSGNVKKKLSKEECLI